MKLATGKEVRKRDFCMSSTRTAVLHESRPEGSTFAVITAVCFLRRTATAASMALRKYLPANSRVCGSAPDAAHSSEAATSYNCAPRFRPQAPLQTSLRAVVATSQAESSTSGGIPVDHGPIELLSRGSLPSMTAVGLRRALLFREYMAEGRDLLSVSPVTALHLSAALLSTSGGRCEERAG